MLSSKLFFSFNKIAIKKKVSPALKSSLVIKVTLKKKTMKKSHVVCKKKKLHLLDVRKLSTNASSKQPFRKVNDRRR